MNFTDAVNKVLEHEGGFVNDPKDSGGATNWGITRAVYAAWLGRDPVTVSVDEVRRMPRSEAVAIYKRNYWDAIGGDKINSYSVAYTLFDQAINRGVATAVKQAQKVIGSPQDGKMGPVTINAINRFSEAEFLSKYLGLSIQAYKDLAENRPKDQKFLQGWLNRVDSIAAYVKVKPEVAAISGIVLLAGVSLFVYLLNAPKGKIA